MSLYLCVCAPGGCQNNRKQDAARYRSEISAKQIAKQHRVSTGCFGIFLCVVAPEKPAIIKDIICFNTAAEATFFTHTHTCTYLLACEASVCVCIARVCVRGKTGGHVDGLLTEQVASRARHSVAFTVVVAILTDFRLALHPVPVGSDK